MPDMLSIVSQMTLEEKAGLCTGDSPWTTFPVNRLGIPTMIVSDGPHGVRRQPEVNNLAVKSLPATCFPTASCLASTWNGDLLAQMGEALAEECIALNVDILLGPGVNIKRSPLGGRNFEYYSEDPFLAGEMAVNLINGIQSRGVGTSLKHFAGNNQETHRFYINTEIDERTLREIYLPAFEKAVKQAKPWTVMCAYNKLNGFYGSENSTLLNDILKKEWGFEGLVVSDWGAVHDRVASLKAGLDLEMPGPHDRSVKTIVEAVQNGNLDESVLDSTVRRILNVLFKTRQTPKKGSFDLENHHQLAARIAAEGMVLLKNNGILPLKGQGHIAVVGRSAKAAHFQGGGSSHINPTRVSNPFEELQARSPQTQFSYADGYPADNSFNQEMIDQAITLAQTADAALLFIALPPFKESEGYDRPDLDLTQQQLALIKAVAQTQPNTIVVLNNGGPLDMCAWINDVSAVLEAWMMGQAGGAAIVDILFGKTNPSGRLAETFPLKLADNPASLNWPGDSRTVRYGEGLFVGYRFYDFKEMPVLFPFGFGLSYTTFVYSNPKISKNKFKDVDGVTISVDITNSGKMTGQEVVQVYVHDRKSSLVRPPKELKGFKKVLLQPGETRPVSISLDFRSFAYYHPEFKHWITEDGDFDILIGASAEDIRCTLPATLESTLDLPCIIDIESTLSEWMADWRGKKVLGPIFPQIEVQSRKIFGGGERYGNENAMGMDIMDMINDMPLVSVLKFLQDFFAKPVEEVVDEYIQEVHKIKK